MVYLSRMDTCPAWDSIVRRAFSCAQLLRNAPAMSSTEDGSAATKRRKIEPMVRYVAKPPAEVDQAMSSAVT